MSSTLIRDDRVDKRSKFLITCHRNLPSGFRNRIPESVNRGVTVIRRLFVCVLEADQ